jgi:solute carrier family 25 phosphate transporter 3
MKQLPYTATKFAVFEATEYQIYSRSTRSQNEMSKLEQLGITFVSGFIGGVASAVTSQPADVKRGY